MKNPTQHRMTRRSATHDYTAPGVYHITMHVADGMGQPFGAVVGNLSAPDGSPDAPRVALSPIGQMVEHELLHSISAHYPMITVQDYVIMPEHIHCLLTVRSTIRSAQGATQSLGQAIAGFKKGCNRLFWENTGQAAHTCDGKTAAHTALAAPSGFPAGNKVPAVPSGFPAGNKAPSGSPVESVPSGFPAGYKVPSAASSDRPPLFSPGYCDVMPVDEVQLVTQRQYIRNNPRTRLLRSSHAWLHTQRGGIATALTPAALSGYLSRECGTAFTPEGWQALSAQLLMAPDGTITCDTFGDRRLLSRPLLPVVCHRRDASRFGDQKARCLAEAAKGTVLVSARISKSEQEIMDEAVHDGFSVVLITDNGFTDRYHPSSDRLAQCASGHLLLLTPWQYVYRPAKERIQVTRCKTINCVAQALCRTKDTWWQEA